MSEPLVVPDLVDDPDRSAAAEPASALETASRRRQWAKNATLSAIALGATGIFLVIERTVRRKANTFDRKAMRSAGRMRSPVLTTIARAVTALGGLPGIVGFSLASLYASRRAPRAAAQIALGALGGVAAELGLKQQFGRARPTELPHLERVTSKSFPSGHAMASASFYLSLAFVGSRGRHLRERRGAALVAAAGIAGTIGMTRVYLGVHWPTDVLGGLALGTAWASGWEAIFDWTAAEQVEREVVSAPTRDDALATP